MSLGEFKGLPCHLSAITVALPSVSYRTTRRIPCWHESWRPSKSNVLPLLYSEGDRNRLVCPSSSSHRIWRLLGMSLHSRNRPAPHHAGPSAHSAPVHRR